MVETEFDRFWHAYPRKTAKAKARKAFDKALCKTDVGTMLRALQWQCKTEQWLQGIIPHAATWLNQERWDDEPPAPTLSNKNARNLKAIFGDDEDTDF